jgi:iron(III) transport system substrate-binding protein
MATGRNHRGVERRYGQGLHQIYEGSAASLLGCTMTRFLLICVFIAGLAALAGCDSDSSESVVVYTALDEIYSRPILDAFTAETGIEVSAVYDTEAAKTTGLVTRLINEAERPRCDVFWNNEVAQTILLKNRGVLAPYKPAAASPIPAEFKDPEGYWTGFAARARVIIYNTELMDSPPTSINDFLLPEHRAKGAIALPLFGTTATHAAALFALWGEEKAMDYFRALKDNEIAFVAGNGAVRDAVARGEYAFGLTDTDDANGAIEDALPAKWLLPDQNGLGTLVIPNSASLVKSGPNAQGAKRLIEYLLSPAVEQRLSAGRSIQIPLNPETAAPESVPSIAKIKTMGVSFVDMAAHMEVSATQLRALLLR